MTIPIRCPACDASLRVGDELAGRKVRCSACKEPVVVPDLPGGEEEAPRPVKRSVRRPAVEQPLIPKRRPKDDDERPAKPVPVWKRELMGAGIYFGCIGFVGLVALGVFIFFVVFDKKAPPPAPVVAQPRTELDMHLEGLTGIDPGRRAGAARQLAMAEPNVPRREEVARALANCLKDMNPDSAVAAAQALRAWATPAVAGDLAGGLASPNDGVRVPCAEALERLGPSAEGVVLPVLTNANPRVRADAARLLGRIGTAASAEALRRAESDEDKVVQATAAAARRAVEKR